MAQQHDSPQAVSPERRTSRPISYQPPYVSDAPTLESSRPRASSTISPERPTSNSHGPVVSEAVNNAFSQTSNSAAVDPNLVAQITEQVINTLKASGSVPASSSPPLQKAAPPQLREQTQSTLYQEPPDRSGLSRSSASSGQSHGAQEAISKAPPVSSDSYVPGVASLSLDQNAPASSSDISRGSMSVPTSSDRQNGRQSIDQKSVTDQPRASPASPTSPESDDRTTLEKIWKPLFDSDGGPTERLGQFLRGLAIHIIEDFDPPKSIVIPPQKMLKFYDTAKLPEEIYPWHSLFGGTMTNSSLSHVYRDLQCEHHFVQQTQREKPCVPSLTPVGFEVWMTHLIRAHPELEYQRFAKAVLHMPISNADDPKERFPKELSRRLFPAHPNMDILLDLEDAVLADPVIELTPYGLEQQNAYEAAPRAQGPIGSSSYVSPAAATRSSAADSPMKASNPTPAVLQQSFSAPVPIPNPPTEAGLSYNTQSFGNPGVQSFSSARSDADSDDISIGRSIERQRKPYRAQPGGGKIYDQPKSGDVPLADSPERQHRAHTIASEPRPVLNEYYVQDPYPRSSFSTSPVSGSMPIRPPNNMQQNIGLRPESNAPPMPYPNHTTKIPPPSLPDNNLRQTTSWSEYNRRNDFPPPPPPPPSGPPRDYPLPPPHPPPPPRAYEDDTLRRQSTYPSSPPRY